MTTLKGIIHSPDDIISPRAYARASFQQMPDFVTRKGPRGVYFEYTNWDGNVNTDLTKGDPSNVTIVDEPNVIQETDEWLEDIPF